MKTKKHAVLIIGLLIIGVVLTSGCIEKQPEIAEGAYVSEGYGFAIVPPEAWDVDESRQFGEIVAFYAPEAEANFTSNMLIHIEELPYEVSLEEYINASKEQLPLILTNYTMVSEQDIVISGAEAYEWVITHEMGIFKIQAKQVIIIKGERAYLITSTALQDNFDTYAPAFEESIQTFQFT